MASKDHASTTEKEVNFSDMVCGYVMPISDTADYRTGHWEDIKSMLDEVTSSLGFKDGRVVSTGLDVSTIHKRIVNNIYNDEIIICDVSSRNPNVMFELGMRIAFDKPVVIIKDNTTQYCFDSGTIEHLEYPKDMRYSEIEKFKTLLNSKLKKTLETYIRNPEESPILHSFGSFAVSKPNIPEMSETEEFRSELQEIKVLLRNGLRERVEMSEEINEVFPKALFGSTNEEVINKISIVPGVRIKYMDDDVVHVGARRRLAIQRLMDSIQ